MSGNFSTPILPSLTPPTSSDSTTTASPSTKTSGVGCPSCPNPSLTAAEGFGIGFGVGIVLLLLALAGTFLYLRRSPVFRLKGADTNSHHLIVPLQSKTERKRRRHMTESIVPVIAGSEQASVIYGIDDLPQPIAHDNLRGDLSQLEVAIKNFVDNYFHRETVSRHDFREPSLMNLAGEAKAGKPWSSSLASSETRTIALRCFIAQVIFKCMALESDPALSLLPPCVLSSNSRITPSQVAPSQRYILAVWRQTTAFLLQGRRSPQHMGDNDPRRDKITLARSAIVQVMEPIRNSKSQERYLEVLQAILEDAAILAFKLFSQEDEWETDWNSSRPGVVVFPSLSMISNDQRTGIRAKKRIIKASVI